MEEGGGRGKKEREVITRVPSSQANVTISVDPFSSVIL